MATFNTLFGVRNLQELVVRFADEAMRQTKMQSLFKMGGMSQQFGEEVELDSLTFGRAPAPFGKLTAPSIRRSNLGGQNSKAPWLEIVVSKNLSMQKIMDRRAPGQLGPDANFWLATELKDLVGQVMRSIELASAHVLMEKTGFSVDDATVPGTQITDTLDWGTLDLDASNSWATASTKILSAEMKAIFRKALQDGGFRPGMAIANADVQSYLIENTQITDHYKNTPAAVSVLTAGDLSAFGGVAGIPSWEIYEESYDKGGVQTKYIENDFICFLPGEQSLGDALAFAEGYCAIPEEDGATIVGAESLDANPQTGIKAYAIKKYNPYAVELVVCYRFLPVVRDPKKVLLFDCSP